jgi:plasmid stabilization system protein ParE
LSDLIDILEWIAHDDPGAPREVVERLEAAGEALGFMATGRKGRVPGTYEKVVSGLPWILVYSISKEPDGRDKLVILRVVSR